VVGLPVAHAGGGFELLTDDEKHVVDWSGTPDPRVLPWVALSGDLDHAVLPVESGARVTLVYALVRTGIDREDAGWSRRFAAVEASVRGLRCADGPVMIACSRHAVGTEDSLVLGINALRGADRELAAVLVRAGLQVRVRACLAASECEDGHAAFPPRLKFIGWRTVVFARLARPIPAATSFLDCVTFVQPSGDGGGFFDEETTCLEPYLDAPIPAEHWLVRRAAAVTLIGELEFASDGFVGNAASETYLYRLAAIEVTRTPPLPGVLPVIEVLTLRLIQCAPNGSRVVWVLTPS
jgi:hypothetical protein